MDNQYSRRKSTRYKDYDYNLPGYYFVTICSDNMEYIFGNIKNGDIKLCDLGSIVRNCWESISEHFHNIELDYYQIMPNHIYGIIIINSVGNANFAFPTDRTKMLLSKAIQQFKRQVTIEAKVKLKIKNKIWQKSFYDRVIRNEKELYNIRKYIKQNPLKWDFEKNTPENLDI